MMFLKSNFLFVCAVVLINFTVNSNAAITSVLNEVTEFEKLITSRSMQAMEDEFIKNNPYKDSVAAKATIEAILKEATRLDGALDHQKAVRPIIDSIITGIRIVSGIERQAYNNLDEALKFEDRDPKTAFQALRNSTKYTENLVLSFGIPVEDYFGSVLAETGGIYHKAIQKCMSYMQHAGTAFINSVRIAGEIGTMGLEAGGRGADVGINAARETISSGTIACFKYCFNGAKTLIDDVLSSTENLTDLTEAGRMQRIISGFETNVTINDPAALEAINLLKTKHEAFLALPMSQAVRDASNIIIKSLISAISENADAMSKAKNALKKAEKIGLQDKQAAIDIVRKGVQDAEDELVHGCSISFVSFGAAKQIVHGVTNDQLIKIMVELIVGRVSINRDLRIVEDMALMALKAEALDQGIYAANTICEAAANALYIQYLESGIMGLDVLRNFL